MTPFLVILLGVFLVAIGAAVWGGFSTSIHPDSIVSGGYLAFPAGIAFIIYGLADFLHERGWISLPVAGAAAGLLMLTMLGIAVLRSVRPRWLWPDWEHEQRRELEAIAEETGEYPAPIDGLAMPDSAIDPVRWQQERERLTAEGIEAELAAIAHSEHRRRQRRQRRAERRERRAQRRGRHRRRT